MRTAITQGPGPGFVSPVDVNDDGSLNTITTQTGESLTDATLTLSASSQALPEPPTGANRALLQVHGGTTTDLTYISRDGTAATTDDFVLRNAADSSGLGAVVELLITGNLEDIRVLGTANAATLVIWWFK